MRMQAEKKSCWRAVLRAHFRVKAARANNVMAVDRPGLLDQRALQVHGRPDAREREALQRLTRYLLEPTCAMRSGSVH